MDIRADRAAMNDENLTAFLAEHGMGWRVFPNRFIKSGQSWIPRRRFRPLKDIADAFRVLEQAADGFCLTNDRNIFTAEVQINGLRGRASGEPKARTVSTAIGRALGLDI